MKHRVCSILLCVLLLAGLCACGKQQSAPADPTAVPEATAAPVSSSPLPPAAGNDDSYAEAYARYWTIYGAVWEEVGRRLEAHNAALESADPTGYFMDPNYLMLVYLPFYTTGPAVGSALVEDQLDAAADLMRSYWPDVQLRQLEENIYQADYTYTDLPENGGITHKCITTWEFSPVTGAFRVIGYTDNILSEFTEFVPQGGDTYLLYTMADKALVTYANGVVTELFHAHMINEAPLGDFAGDVRLNSLQDYDFYPDVTADTRWITEEPNAQYVITLTNDVMTYTGKIPTDVLAADGLTRTGVTWTDAEPIILQK